MKRWTLAASVTLAVSMPAAAAAKTVTPQHAREYSRMYQQVARRFGHRAPGRNIVRWGFGPGQGVTDGQVVTSIAELERMLAPPPPPPSLPPLPSPAAATATAAAQPSSDPAPADPTPSDTASGAAPSSSSLPACTWQPESGGDPSAVNSSSGAGGYYQIMPSTWQAYGGSGAPQDAPMSEQTAIAQRIYQSQGPGAWANC
jgi:hypothetical protein